MVELVVLVVLLLDPLWYVVVDSWEYPPLIVVLEPEVFVWELVVAPLFVVSAQTGPSVSPIITKHNKIDLYNLSIVRFLFFYMLLFSRSSLFSFVIIFIF